MLPNTQSVMSRTRDIGLCNVIRKPGSSFYIKVSCYGPSTIPLHPEHTIDVLDEAPSSVSTQPPSNSALQFPDSIWTTGNASFGGQDVVGLRIGAAGTNKDGSSRNSLTTEQMGEVIEALQHMYQSEPDQPSLFSISDDRLGPLSCGSLLSGPTYPNEHLLCWDERDTYCESGLCAAWLQG